MFKKVTLTLLVYLVAIFAISSFAEAKTFDSVNRRNHESLNRFIKKRAATDTTDTAAAANSATGTDTAASTGTTSPASSSTAATSASSSSSSSASKTSSSTTASASSSASTSSSSSSSTSSSSTSTSSSSSASSTSPSSTASTTAQTSQSFSATQVSGDDTKTSVISGTLVTLTESVAASSTPSSEASVSGATSTGKTAGITVVIVIAASVGGITILWTIFRKWKLGRSGKFDQRLQPINWQMPTNEDSGLPVHRRRASDTSSFQSGMHGGASDLGHGSSEGHGTYGAADLPPLPPHDFTAGPTHLAPVGGYADLARGPSPQPQMQETLNRAPSFSHHYDTNVPLHHQTGYGAAGGY